MVAFFRDAAIAESHQNVGGFPQNMTLAPPRETRRSFPPIVAGIGISILFLALAFITNSKVLLDPDVVFSFNDGNIDYFVAALGQVLES